MSHFRKIAISFGQVSVGLADQAKQEGRLKDAGMYIALARAIFDLSDAMASPSKSKSQRRPPRKHRTLLEASATHGTQP